MKPVVKSEYNMNYGSQRSDESKSWREVEPGRPCDDQMPSVSGQQERIRHPAHLRGKAIGMFYARRNRAFPKEKRSKDKLAYKVNLNTHDEKQISTLLHKIKNEDCSAYSRKDTSSFQQEYHSHLQSVGAHEQIYKTEVDGLQPNFELNQEMKESQRRMEENPHFQQMLTFRRKLPAIKQQQEIVNLISSNQVVVISGETGCGKTTQVPQFILDSYIEQGRGSECHIICTQPRRISAISVAERVADERSTQCGGSNSSIGWQIRLENKIPRSIGSILYCTTGIVLQWLKKDSLLRGLSHIVLDEIHERDLDSDFLMIILRDLLVRRPDLKLILMSATLNAYLFSKYFGNAPMVNIPGYTFPVTEYFLEDILEKTGYVPAPKTGYGGYQKRNSKYKDNEKMKEWDDIFQPFLREIGNKYSRKTINTLEEWDEAIIDLNLIHALLKHISTKEQEGAVLVFVPGWAEIGKLHNLLMDDNMFNSSHFLILPLHSMMPTINQKEIFNSPPPGVRKIIIATNIAETSITIDDVVFVVDCGFIKMTNFDVKENVSTLKPEWVALANARQRRGRAGRVKPGICFKLYMTARQLTFQEYCLPEMIRTRLESLCLKIKILKLGSIEAFLSKAMNPPAPESVTHSIVLLKKLNALDDNEMLTPLGFHLARLPLDPQTGKMILMGAIFGCLDPILTVAASLSFKDAFIIPLGKEDLVDQRKAILADNTQSDHLMLANAFQQWEEHCRTRTDREFCWQNFLSLNTLKMLLNLKKQFAEYLQGLHFLHCSDPKHKDFNRNSDNKMLLKAIICAGLYPNIARLNKKKSSGKKGRTPSLYIPDGTGSVQMHPKSVLNTVKLFSSLWVVYYQKVKSTKVFLHDMTVVHPYALLFFGGQLTSSQLCLSTDDWITFCCPKRMVQLIPELRKELDNLLEHKINAPGPTDWSPESKEGAVLTAIVELLSNQDSLEDRPSSNATGYGRQKYGRFDNNLSNQDYRDDGHSSNATGYGRPNYGFHDNWN